MTTVPAMTLDEICANVRELSAANGWDQTDTSARMLHVMSEIGEVADALVSLQAADGDRDIRRAHLGYEIFDAIWNLCARANTAGINIVEAARTKMSINSTRAWPPPSS